ncbi:hypothetical protein BO71DRAFT_337530 [Aspergillus ellipticus CBS 707.79]|uniref:Uncharacterized protein n=1 Tax=Aspergillus ellipticus CBS 707.79 TaxID=1448320 RepID=A0A319CUY5_9EURO|nr:hypothetical protein BO71DRAFT_337530 [Aspergillus ellipticus CBS 707.79]
MLSAYLYYPIYCSLILGLVPNNPEAQYRGCLSYNVLGKADPGKGALDHAGLGYHIWYLNEKTFSIYQKVDLGLIFLASSLGILFLCFRDVSDQAFSINLPTSGDYYLRYLIAPYYSSSRYSADNSRIMYSGCLVCLCLSANIKVLEHYTSRKVY